MEKRSRNYLTREARQDILRLGWLSHHSIEAGLWYAEERKGKLVKLSELEDQRGLLASLNRLKASLGVKMHGLANKSAAWFGGNLDKVIQTDRIVQADLGKVGVH